MGVKVTIATGSRAGTLTTVTIGKRGAVRVRIEGSGDRGGAAVGALASRRDGAAGSVTPEMLDEGVRVFLGQGDARRLGNALAKVYDAMERVRLSQRLPDVDRS